MFVQYFYLPYLTDEMYRRELKHILVDIFIKTN